MRFSMKFIINMQIENSETRLRFCDYYSQIHYN